MKKILCLCTANQGRSVALAAMLQQHLGSDWVVESAGTSDEFAGQPANVHMTAALAAKGFDASGHRSRCIGALDLAGVSHIVCATPAHRAKLGPYLSHIRVLVFNEAEGGLADPYNGVGDGRREDFDHCLEQIEASLPSMEAQIRDGI